MGLTSAVHAEPGSRLRSENEMPTTTPSKRRRSSSVVLTTTLLAAAAVLAACKDEDAKASAQVPGSYASADSCRDHNADRTDCRQVATSSGGHVYVSSSHPLFYGSGFTSSPGYASGRVAAAGVSGGEGGFGGHASTGASHGGFGGSAAGHGSGGG